MPGPLTLPRTFLCKFDTKLQKTQNKMYKILPEKLDLPKYIPIDNKGLMVPLSMHATAGQ